MIKPLSQYLQSSVGILASSALFCNNFSEPLAISVSWRPATPFVAPLPYFEIKTFELFEGKFKIKTFDSFKSDQDKIEGNQGFMEEQESTIILL